MAAEDRTAATEREWIAGVVLMAELGALDEEARESIIRTGRALLEDLKEKTAARSRCGA